MISIEETSNIFNVEAEKLESTINAALEKSELTIPEIVQTYYQTINVSSLATVLKQQLGSANKYNSMLARIEETEKLISEKFDSNLHHLVMGQLTNSIANATKNLQSGNTSEKSKDEIENEAKLYEKLREIMSTKEFVEQYDKGLSHD
jgi:uncharacterized phage infection (PIP) family protein YhgE